jgi:hypothetical protein
VHQEQPAAANDDLPSFGDLNGWAANIHARNVAAGWWTDLNTGADLHGVRNVGELLMLCVSEVAEGTDGWAFNLMDDKLTHRSMIEVELADTKIRIFDLAGAHNIDLTGAYREVVPTLATYTQVTRNLLEIVCQLSHAMEGHRKSAQDRQLTYRTAFEVRLAAALVMIDHMARTGGMDVDGAMVEKLAYNAERADHKPENRRAAGGKKY